MGFVINPERKFTFEYEIEEGEWISVTYDFPYSEDARMDDMRKELKTLSKKESKKILERIRKKMDRARDKEEEPELTDKEFELNRNSINIFYKMIRQSLVDWSGFTLRDGSELPVRDKKGKIIDKNRDAVYEFCKRQEDLFDKITLAYGGEVDSKNLKIGLSQSLNSDGAPTSA